MYSKVLHKGITVDRPSWRFWTYNLSVTTPDLLHHPHSITFYSLAYLMHIYALTKSSGICFIGACIALASQTLKLIPGLD